MLILKYQPSWENDFEQIKNVLFHALDPTSVGIEHVGSTAVPGLGAKNIIDIDLIYHNESDFNRIKTSLQNLGYFHAGDQGIEGREVFKRNGTFHHHVLDAITHHLYVCHSENLELKRHLAFRDFLGTHEDERKAYEILKEEIADKANQDKKEYARLKEILAKDFIEGILAKIDI